MQHCRPWDSALLIQITQLNYLVSKPTCEFKYIHQSSFFMPFLAFILILTRFCLLYEQCDRFINYILYPSVYSTSAYSHTDSVLLTPSFIKCFGSN